MSGETKFRQDMPPPGGYRDFNFARTFPKMVWRPGVVVAAIFGTAVYGGFHAIATKKASITEKFEDVDINNAMQPFLTAERDRYSTYQPSSVFSRAIYFLIFRWLKLLKRNRDLEEEVMKDVPGWKTGTWYGEPVYFTLGDKWWDPIAYEVFAHSDKYLMNKERYWSHHSDYAAPKFYDKWIPRFIAKYIW
uniref:NADH dehydrogenase [ubiquinone] 1 alpha subcomplex subunit 13 n=1 Tax=Angiostrongylus cantonensis TaxID=6313 RepID=A0A0K0D238_ANGCA